MLVDITELNGCYDATRWSRPIGLLLGDVSISLSRLLIWLWYIENLLVVHIEAGASLMATVRHINNQWTSGDYFGASAAIEQIATHFRSRVATWRKCNDIVVTTVSWLAMGQFWYTDQRKQSLMMHEEFFLFLFILLIPKRWPPTRVFLVLAVVILFVFELEMLVFFAKFTNFLVMISGMRMMAIAWGPVWLLTVGLRLIASSAMRMRIFWVVGVLCVQLSFPTK